MEPIKIKLEDFKLENFINYYEDNIEELLSEYNEQRKEINLIDKDYMDVISSDEEYENLKDANDYKEVLLDEEYALHFIIGKTYEGQEKIELLDGMKYNLKHYLDDLYEDNDTIKDIGDLNLDLDHFIGLLFDYDNNELSISVTNYEHGCGVSKPRMEEIEETGDVEDKIKELLERFMI